ncbi:MAG: ATP-binding protein [Deltaproteobacteria bacterium]|jgi:chromosomal replication initiator protein|nr:ATP-binding protein [Deltaproteobacteria bacterium]
MNFSHDEPEAIFGELSSQTAGYPDEPRPDPKLALSDEQTKKLDLWPLVKEQLAKSLTSQEFDSWIKPIKAEIQGQTLVLETPTAFSREWIERYHFERVRSFVEELGQSFDPPLALEINLVEATPLKPATSPSLVAAPDLKLVPHSEPTTSNLYPLVGPLNLLQRFNFSTFVPSQANKLAYEAAQAFARDVNLDYNILFMSGGPGLGKSHLIQAIAQAHLDNFHRKKVSYLRARDFSEEYYKALDSGQIDAFRRKYCYDCDLLLLEDLQYFIEGKKPKFQAEFNQTLDLLLNHNKKIVLTSKKDLKTYLSLGDSFSIPTIFSSLEMFLSPPDYEARLGIFSLKAKMANLPLNQATLEYLAEQPFENVRLIESCLLTLTAKNRYLQKLITLEDAKNALSKVSEQAKNPATPETIKSFVCQQFMVKEDEICSGDKHQNIKTARAVGIYLVVKLAGLNYQAAADLFGRTRTTAYNSISFVEKEMIKDSKFHDKVEFLIDKLDEKKR